MILGREDWRGIEERSSLAILIYMHLFVENLLILFQASGSLMQCGRSIPQKVGVQQFVRGADGEKMVAKLEVPYISPIPTEDMVSCRYYHSQGFIGDHLVVRSLEDSVSRSMVIISLQSLNSLSFAL